MTSLMQLAHSLLTYISRSKSDFDPSTTTDADMQLILAQLSHTPIESEEIKHDLIKRVAIDYCIPEKTFGADNKNDYSGYTCLHFAAKSQDVHLAEKLLSFGVDLFKQGIHDGCTALHLAVNEMHPCKKIGFYNWNVYQLVGDIQEKTLVNILLSAHVKSHNTVNPKCFKNGISHLHIACMFDHIEAVKFFLRHGEPINQAVNIEADYLPGYTPLHFAVRYSSLKTVEILVKHDADLNLRDAKHDSALDLMVQRLMTLSTLVDTSKLDANVLYSTELKKVEAMINLIVQTVAVWAPRSLELPVTHIACTLKDKSVIDRFLQQNVDINQPVPYESISWRLWTPLHFGAHFNFETFKLLLENGAKGDSKIYAYRNPLDICLNKYSPEVVHSILSTSDQFKDIVLSDKLTKLSDLVLVLHDCQKLDNFLQNVSDVNISVPSDSKIWPGYTILHFVVTMSKYLAFRESIRLKYHFQDHCSYHRERDHLQDEDKSLYKRRIDVCLNRGCDVSRKNAEGWTVVHYASHFCKEDVVEKLMDHCKVDVADSESKITHLHIACSLGKIDLVKRLLSEGADVNAATNENSYGFDKEIKNASIEVTENSGATPLHFAVNREKIEMVKLLLENKADVHAKDELGLTPIHYCFFLTESKKDIGRILLKSVIDLKDSTENLLGLSYLHVAAYVDDPEAVKKLIESDVNVNLSFKPCLKRRELKWMIGEYSDSKGFLKKMNRKTALHFAVEEKSLMAMHILFKSGADFNLTGDRNQSPLQYAMYFDKYLALFARKFKRDKLNAVKVIDKTGLTLLHVACASFDIKWAKKLMKNGADPNARICDQMWFGATPLHVLVLRAKSLVIEPRNFVNFAKLLVKYGADVTAKDDRGFTAVGLVAEAFFKGFYHNKSSFMDEQDVDFLLPFADFLIKSQKTYDVNPTDNHGFSHFHYACMRQDIETATKFVNFGADVNQPTNPFSIYNGFTPLHFALAYSARSVSYLLIERGADVEAEDAYGNKPLHVAIKRNFVDFELIETLVSHGADINAKNVRNHTPLNRVLRSYGLTLERLEFFLNRGCSMGIINPVRKNTYGIVGLAMFKSVPDDLQAISAKFMAEKEVQNAIANGFNFIHNVVSVFQISTLLVGNYLEAIEEFMKYGYDFDKQDAEGQTALHCAVNFKNCEAIKALLSLGADMNIKDSDNKLPFSDKIFGYHEDDGDDLVGTNVVKILAYHVIKMKSRRIDVDETNARLSEEIHKRFPLSEDLQHSYLNELMKMESTKLNDRLNVKNFMSELGAVAEYPRMYLAHRKIVDEFFKNVNNIREQFPEFCGLLMMQYRKAVRRKEMWQSAKDALRQICPVRLPRLCVEAILRFLITSELEVFIESVNEI